MKLCWSDTETYSDIPITHGTHAYAEHAEIMLWAFAIDDGPARVWDLTTGDAMPSELKEAIADENCIFVFHNSHFDRTVLRHCGWTIPVERIHDTMAQAMAHSLPGALAKLCDILNVPTHQAKDKAGKQLIQLLCKPRPLKQKLRRATRTTHPAEWASFVEYARRDIEAMRHIYGKLPSWNYRNGELKLWHLDQRINDRGIAVDLELAHAAVACADRIQSGLAADAVRLSDGEVGAATQRDALLLHIFNNYGIRLPDLRGSTVDDMLGRVADLPDALRELLVVRSQASRTSTTKYKRLVQATSHDGRLRGLLQFCGASRTGRWAGRTFQPQNLQRIPKHIKKQYDHAIAAVKADAVDLVFESPMEVLGSVVRGALVAAPGKKFCIADLSNIEGRMLAWLSREEWKLQAFRAYDAGQGADLYKLAYAKAFGIRAEDVDDGDQRQIGKVMELALGYQGGVGAFITFAAAYGIDLEAMADKAWSSIPEQTTQEARDFMEWRYGETKGAKAQFYLDQGATIAVAQQQAEAKRGEVRFGLSEKAFIVCDSFKRLWRQAHSNTVAWWKELNEAARRAVLSPGMSVPARSVKFRKDGSWLRCLLPSGRYICYPFPEVDAHGQVSFMGVNQFNRHWCRIRTYGGKFCLAGDTPVMTQRGWVPIAQVRLEGKIWDGTEWVRHSGVVSQGVKRVVKLDGIRMTPDHLVLTSGGWKHASSCEGLHRADFWLPDGAWVCGYGRPTFVLEFPVRMRAAENTRSGGCGEAREARGAPELRMLRRDAGSADHAWNVRPSRFCGVGQHVGALLSRITCGVEKLRGARDRGMRAVARIVFSLLGRYARLVPAWADAGQDRQLRRVLPAQLSVGDVSGAGPKQKELVARGYSRRVPTDGDPRFNSPVPLGKTPVFDITNAGPRARFVVLGANGPLVVHNCENITQASARDVFAHAMPLLEDAGYPIVLGVHDENITETPDTDAFSSTEVARIMSIVPVWCQGLPLAAAGFETTRYKKE